MSLYKVLLLSGAAAFVSSATLAAEFQGKDIPTHASAVAGFHGVAAHLQLSPTGASKTAKCGTGFGAELTSPDGLISWNDTTEYGYNTSGAADFTCSITTKIKQVWVIGSLSFGTNPEQYNVTFYKNDGAGGSDEANDSRVVCAYTGILAEGGVSFPYPVLSHIKLPTPCKFKAGKKYWVEVQNNDPDDQWYWEVTSQLSGTPGDWVDRNNMFGTGCTSLDNDRYLVDCLGYTYPDYMLELH
ncbi:MAG: hypothetical protein ACJ8EL_09820 [Rhizomicrobium sp.]|jgi:hypothetical protein